MPASGTRSARRRGAMVFATISGVSPCPRMFTILWSICQNWDFETWKHWENIGKTGDSAMTSWIQSFWAGNQQMEWNTGYIGEIMESNWWGLNHNKPGLFHGIFWGGVDLIWRHGSINTLIFVFWVERLWSIRGFFLKQVGMSLGFLSSLWSLMVEPLKSLGVESWSSLRWGHDTALEFSGTKFAVWILWWHTLILPSLKVGQAS